MSVEIKKTKLYFKLLLIALVVIMVVLVLFMNRKQHASVWFFGEYKDVNVLKLMLMTAVASIISFWILTTGFKLAREWREVSKQIAQREREKQLEQKAKALDEREQRIDEKINRALSDSQEE